ncbi:hypothetical protein [Photobacterium sanguinicancri]|uniref:Uncharacterized protein n=1 Tax=Photobacterium sanguinicancri TaxID=875932 RepID=A0AAW7YDB5_9GAMM|nr:hypothetical protein [Photobacterium sanguinicancri]MDO6545549.1 hypothetical protein [Photobacterium sanguinicancri]
MKPYLNLVVYFFIMLALPKALNYMGFVEDIYIYLVYLVAFLYAYKNLESSKFIPVYLVIYFSLFCLDLLIGVNFITSDKTESFVLGIGSSILFVFPMTLGLLIRCAFENVTRTSR